MATYGAGLDKMPGICNGTEAQIEFGGGLQVPRLRQ